jgi:hypothetical protein
LVAHLHAFVSEVRLEQHEWNEALEALASTGDAHDARVQQLVLFSDTLGLSMLLDALAHAKPAGATESTVLGPFYVPGAPLRDYGESIVGRRAGMLDSAGLSGTASPAVALPPISPAGITNDAWALSLARSAAAPAATCMVLHRTVR